MSAVWGEVGVGGLVGVVRKERRTGRRGQITHLWEAPGLMEMMAEMEGVSAVGGRAETGPRGASSVRDPHPRFQATRDLLSGLEAPWLSSIMPSFQH